MATTFAELTTMRIGGPTAEFVVANSTDELVEIVRASDSQDPGRLLIMSGGSNLVVGDVGWPGLTVQVKSSELHIDGSRITVDAGVNFDDVVVAALDAGLAGLEPLSGIPGSAGATPVQNVGAYGLLTSQLLESVQVLDRRTGEIEDWPPTRCAFTSHRQSAFKHTDRFVILTATFELRKSHLAEPIEHDKLAHHLGLPLGSVAPSADVRAAVLELRDANGSIYRDTDLDTWGTGSFFINPVFRVVPEPAMACPRRPDQLGWRLAAGWLIDKAGFPPGYGLHGEWGEGRVALSTKHALAVSNRGGATTSEVMAFAAHIRAGVEEVFGIRLGPECDLVNCSFDDPGYA